MQISWQNIPSDLQARAQWVLWKYVTRHGKTTKMPYQPDGRAASTTDPATWSTFAAVRAAVDGYDGIGFVLRADDPYVGVDLDHVINTETGEVSRWAQEIIDALNSYTEITPGGDGLRVWIQIDTPVELTRKKRAVDGREALEVYQDGRYFTVTGQRWGDEDTICERSSALQIIHDRYLVKETSTADASPISPPTPLDLSDSELLARIRRSKQGTEFDVHWTGASKDADGGMNGGDLALCNILAFWCGGDVYRIDSLFRQSGRMRGKWDAQHYADGQTYGEHTVACALAGRTAFYTPRDARAPRERAATPTAVDPWEETPEPWEPTPEDEEAPIILHPGEAIANNRQEWVSYTDRNGKEQSKPVYHALRASEIADQVRRVTGGWPRVVDGIPFALIDNHVTLLATPESLFAWMNQQCPISWRQALDHTGVNYMSKAEFHAAMGQMSQQYDAVALLPHEPSLPRHYYRWEPDYSYVPDGSYFNRLCSYFDNVESSYDATLIRAMFLTPAWGGPYGMRPAWAIMAPDRGCGKSTLANAVGLLYGGMIEAALTLRAEDELLSRLLTPDARNLRVVRLDNIKGEVSSAQIEGLITAETISGHQKYKGEGRRPNNLMWILTGNGMRLSRDISERCFIIRLSRPVYRPDWESRIRDYIDASRTRILMDILRELRQPPAEATVSERWATWVAQVLCRCTQAPDALLRCNQDRRSGHDSDLEEAGMIWESILTMRADKSEYYGSGWRFADRAPICDVVNNTLGTRMTTKVVMSLLRQHIEAGRMKGKMEERCMHGPRRGFIFYTGEDQAEAPQ
jgi:putative DNA primase/helicase